MIEFDSKILPCGLIFALDLVYRIISYIIPSSRHDINRELVKIRVFWNTTLSLSKRLVDLSTGSESAGSCKTIHTAILSLLKKIPLS